MNTDNIKHSAVQKDSSSADVAAKVRATFDRFSLACDEAAGAHNRYTEMLNTVNVKDDDYQ